MQESENIMLMKVLYKLPSERKPQTLDIVVSSLNELMTMLKRDGITKDTVEFLYVHYSPRGTTDVMELVAVNHQKNGRAATNVVPFPTPDTAKDAPKTSKPRVRIKATMPVAETVYSYLYHARQM